MIDIVWYMEEIAALGGRDLTNSSKWYDMTLFEQSEWAQNYYNYLIAKNS